MGKALGGCAGVVAIAVAGFLLVVTNWFNGHYWLFGLACAAVSAVVAGVLAMGRTPKKDETGGGVFQAFYDLFTLLTFGTIDRSQPRLDPNKKESPAVVWGLVAAGATFVVELVLIRYWMYYQQPVFQGALFGWASTLFVVLAPACALGLLCSGFSRRSILASVLAAVVLVVIPCGQYVLFAWGPGNAQKFAKLANIETAPAGATIPPTDPNHLVLVPRSVAYFRSQNEVGNLASRFHIEEEDFTLQSVNGHLYWVCPLVVFNFKDTWNFGNPESPGYVVHDAEDPEAQPLLKTGYHINLWSSQGWALNLERFLYTKGYTQGRFSKAKFEVDNEWNPYWVVGYIQNQFGGGTSGEVLTKVIVVKLDEKPTCKEYDPRVPEQRAEFAWVDRAMPEDLVLDYLKQWGYYDHDYARKNSISNWLGTDKTDTSAPTELEVSYTKGEESVYVVPMKTTNSSNNGITGLIAFDTNRNQAMWYPAVKETITPGAAISVLEKAPANKQNGYHVEHIQLVQIYGTLTYVGIYAVPQDSISGKGAKSKGKAFGGICLVHAHNPNPSDVIVATDKATALLNYKTQLAAGNQNVGHVEQKGEHSKKVTAKVLRIAPLPGGAVTTYFFKVEGDPHTFTVTRAGYADVALLEKGDVVSFEYLDTEETQVAVRNLTCAAIDNIGKENGKTGK